MNRIQRILFVMVAAATVSVGAHAQVAPGALTEEMYVGQPLPAGARIERRANAAIVAVGVTTFVAAYVPWAIQGVVLATNPPAQGGTNWDHAFVWRTIPLVGPFIAIANFNSRNATDCPAYMAHPTMETTLTGGRGPGFVDYPPACDGSMPSPTGNPMVLTNHNATPGDWFWAISMSALQVTGIAMTVWGLLADRYVVHDQVGAVHASTHHPLRWSVMPGAGTTPIGLTFSAINF